MTKAEPLDPLAAWRAVLLAHNRALRAIEADLHAASAIPLTWYDVLLELHGAGGRLRMQDLAARVVLSRTRVSRLVDDMEDRGLVRREPDPEDGRATLATMTDAGDGALRTTAPLYRDGIDRHFTSHLTGREQKVIAEALWRVVEAHDARPARRR